MLDVRVFFDGHQLVDLYAAIFGDAAEVIAAEVDQHQMLSYLLGVAFHFFGESVVLVGGLAARPRARDRAVLEPVALAADQHLGRSTDDLPVAEVQQEHIRRRV